MRRLPRLDVACEGFEVEALLRIVVRERLRRRAALDLETETAPAVEHISA